MPEKIELTTWYFEMHAPPERQAAVAPEGLEIVRAVEPPIHFYRDLYDTIGSPWVWWERKRQSDAQVLAEIHAPGVELWVPYFQGVPVGMSEIDFRKDGEAFVAYFGILPEYCGRGWGRDLIDWSIGHAFARGVGRLWLHTCSLDSPAAVRTYTAAGFTQYDVKIEWIDDPAAG